MSYKSSPFVSLLYWIQVLILNVIRGDELWFKGKRLTEKNKLDQPFPLWKFIWLRDGDIDTFSINCYLFKLSFNKKTSYH